MKWLRRKFEYPKMAELVMTCPMGGHWHTLEAGYQHLDQCHVAQRHHTISAEAECNVEDRRD